MPRPSRTFTLSTAVLAANLGTGIMCLADAGQGRAYRLHAERPGAEANERRYCLADGSVKWLTRADALTRTDAGSRADLPSGAAHVIAPVESASPLILVRISGPL